MLQIRFDPEEGVDLSGKATDLLQLGNILMESSKCNEPAFIKTDSSFDPDPYPEKLSVISIQVADRPNLIQADQSTLYISGTAEFMKNLSDNLLYFEDKSLEDGAHIHYDKIWPDSLLDEDSLDLIIMLRRQNA